MNIDNKFYNYEISPRSYSLLDVMEGRVKTEPVPDIPDSFIKAKTDAYKKMQEENKAIFLSHISKPSKKYLDKFSKLPDYGDYLYPFFADKKPAELDYLYKLASLKDSQGEMRIPAVGFPYFSTIPHERLKILEPVIMSKNYIGGWNYSASYIRSLDNFSDQQLALMSKLAKNKVNGYTLQTIAKMHPFKIDGEKFAQKAEILNKIYGNNLREVSLFVNDNKEFFITAKVSLPHSKNIPDEKNFKEVYAQIDYNFNPISADKDSNIDNIAKNLHQKIQQKLCLFTEKDLNKAILNIMSDFPDATEEEILVVMQKLTQFANYSSLKNIAEEINIINAKKTVKIGDINSCFDYLFNSKKIRQLPYDPEAKYAFFITKNDINNEEEMSYLRECINEGMLPNIHFINLEGWSDGVNLLTDDKKLEEKTKTILKKAKKLNHKEKNLTFSQAVSKVLNNQIETTLKSLGAPFTTIKTDAPASRAVILEQMKPAYPSEDILKSTIQTIPQHYINSKNLAKGVEFKLAQYYDENLNVYSKQSIVEKLRILNTKINEYLNANNLLLENVYLVYPKSQYKTKSFEIITKMYAELYDISPQKIKPINNIKDLNQMPANSTFIILDDIAATGKSMTNIAEYIFYGKHLDKDKHLIFAPIYASDKGIEYINSAIAKQDRTDSDIVLYIDTNINKPSSTKDIFGHLYYKLNTAIYSCDGYDDSRMCIAFPYMTPDNNSTIASDLTKYFVPDYRCIKNPDTELLNIEEKTYYNNIFSKSKTELE